MGKVCIKPTLKTNSIPLFNFGKQLETAKACMRFLKIKYFKRGHEKGNFIFSFAPSHFLWTKF